jgi:hypothetical protein
LEDKEMFLHAGNIKETIVFVVFCSLFATWITGCTASVGIDWHGETGKSNTTISKEFVKEAKNISDRRY